MRGSSFVAKRALPVAGILACLLASACGRRASEASGSTDAAGGVMVAVRVPGGLSVARAIDTLSVAIDPASLGERPVTTHAGAVLGVETDTFVFRQGEDRPVLERRAVAPGADFAVVSSTWTTARDGVPAPGTKYVVEVQLLLFETDAPARADWDPHSGKLEALWRGTLRQAEE